MKKKPFLSDREIFVRLRAVHTVVTPVRGVRNRVVDLLRDAVIVRSERTGRARVIPFAHLREAATVTTNGVIVRAIASILGLLK